MYNHIFPGRLTWTWRMDVWKTPFLYNPGFFGFHVNLQGSK